MFSLIIRNLIFAVLLPGMVAGYIPYLILGKPQHWISPGPLNGIQWLGIPAIIIGFVILLNCILRFAVYGKGTLSPLAPTKKLVVTGLYRYTRNPMYTGVMLMLAGEAMFYRSGSLWLYLVFVFIGFNLFIIGFEEPRLRREFSREYDDYCMKVRRWL